MAVQDAGIVHKDVEMIDSLGDGLHSPIDTSLIRDIENDGDDGRNGEGDSGSFDGIERSSG
jgi:hypothetical protein